MIVDKRSMGEIPDTDTAPAALSIPSILTQEHMGGGGGIALHCIASKARTVLSLSSVLWRGRGQGRAGEGRHRSGLMFFWGNTRGMECPLQQPDSQTESRLVIMHCTLKRDQV